MTEHTAQSMVFSWAMWNSKKYPELKLLFAIPNAGKRSIGAAAYMRSEGLKSGVPDVCLPVPRGEYGALYIEMKTIKGKVSPNQAAWVADLQAAGNKVEVCRTYEDAVKALSDYLRLPKDR